MGSNDSRTDTLLVSVIIPTLNEAAAIEEVIERTRLACPPGTEIIIVDNHSSDDTVQRALRRGARVERQAARGKGNAMRFGAARAAGEILVFIDGDATYPPEAIPSLVKPCVENLSDIVYGSRFLGGGRPPLPVWRCAGNRLLSMAASRLFGKTTDLLTGFFAVRRDVFDRLTLTSCGFEIETELFIKARRSGGRMAEIPIEFSSRKGESKLCGWRDTWRICRTMMRYVMQVY